MLFVAAISLPSVQMYCGFYREFDNLENRPMAPLPSFQWKRPGLMTGQLNAYLNDHFGFRPDLIRWNCRLRMELLGTSPIPTVIPGRDSWLFYCAEAVPDGNSLNDYLGTIPLSNTELWRLKYRLETNRQAFEKLNIPYLVVIAPNKSTVYGEFLMDEHRRNRPVTRMDQLMDALRSAGDAAPVVDLRHVLQAASKNWPVFYRTDTHWNRFGAYMGYREIIRNLGKSLAGLETIQVAPGRLKLDVPRQGGDLAQLLYMQDLIMEENEVSFDLAENTEGPRWGTLILRHDSFGDALYPYLRQHFSKIVNIAPFAPFDYDRIVRERPAAVVHLFVERYIVQAIHDSFFYPEEAPASP
jgi:hypothetical protein